MSTMDRFVRWLTGEEIVDQESTKRDRVEPEHKENGRSSESSRTVPPLESNASDYGVTVEETVVEPGTTYWRAVRVYHLAPDENNGRHHVFLDAVSSEGERIQGSEALITWDGGEQVVTLDKPDSEPGANFPMWKWQECSVKMLGLPSDVVRGLSTNHADEPNPDGSQSGNTLFHHSFFVVFEKVRAPEAVGTVVGRVDHASDGMAVELLRGGSVIETAILGADGTFTFRDVRPGEYKVRAEDQQQTVVVPAGATIRVGVALTPHNSVVEGIVHNGGGLLLRLVIEGEVLAEGRLGKSGTFRLRNLAPGNYFLQVLRKGAVEPMLHAGPLVMDGSNTRRVELTVSGSQETLGSPLNHYVLFGAPERPSTRSYISALAPVLAEKRLAFGFDMHEAVHANEVTVIGDDVAESVPIYLSTRGVSVRRLAGTPQEVADKLHA